jgi:hypothetical protein
LRFAAHAEGVVVFKKDLWILPLLALCLACSYRAQSATVFETTQLVGATAGDDAALPAPITFEVAAASTYTLTLSDLGLPQELGSLRAIVTRDLAVIAQLEVDYSPASLAPPANKDFDATPGSYRIHVLGIPDTGALAGGFGVLVAPKVGGPALTKHSDMIAAPAVPDSRQSTLHTTFNVTQAGTYRLQLTDLLFPEALDAAPQVLLLQDAPSGPVIVSLNQGMFDATPGTYQLLIRAIASATSLSGLYNVRVDSGDNTAALYVSTQPVGNLPRATDVTITAAGTHALTLTDAVFPASLTSLSAVVTQNGAVLEKLDAAGTKNVVAAQGPAQVYVHAAPSATEGVGAFSVQLTRAGTEVYANVVPVDASAEPQSPAIYSVESSAAVTAGPYQLQLEDFERPEPLSLLKAAMTQGAIVRGLLASEGTAQFNLQAGRLKVLVALRLPTSSNPAESRNALFGLTVTAGGGGTPLLETTRGVGGFFRTHPVVVPAAGPYDLTLQDLAFPDSMRDAMLVITRGTDLIAQIYGSSTVTKQQLGAGTYVLNFLGRPAVGESYGAYGLKIANSPPLPTVTLSAASASVTSGQSTTLNWAATDATTCTASNGWSGAKNTTGSLPTGALTANTTYDLSCTGPGGTGNASVTVTVSPPSAGGRRGGGGAMNLLLMGALCFLMGMRRRTRTG